jgi:hypothetical protein
VERPCIGAYNLEPQAPGGGGKALGYAYPVVQRTEAVVGHEEASQSQLAGE